MIALWAGAVLAFGGPVTEVAITPLAERTSVYIAVGGNVEYRDFTMEGPNRLVVDVMGAQYALPKNEWTDVDRGGVRSVRASQYSANVVRIVFVLKQPLGYTVIPDEGGLHISLENPEGAFAPWSSQPDRTFVPSSLVPARDPLVLAGSPRTRQEAPQAQQQRRDNVPRVNFQFSAASIQEVVVAFSHFTGKSMVVASGVTGSVTANIQNQPWDSALREILLAQGLDAIENEDGLIRVDQLSQIAARDTTAPLVTHPYQIHYGTALEVQTQIEPLLSARGNATTATSTNTIIVRDIESVHAAISTLLTSLDRRIPQVSISAKIIFVNRTELDELGVRYELKDSRGNQLNVLSPGGSDFNGDGVIDLSEIIPQGQSVVSLGGSSIAALGNGAATVASPTLQLLSSLAIGRHQLISFVDALQSVNLSNIQANPNVTTLDNQQARIFVGETTPIRTIEAGAGANAGGTFPTASVDEKDTGIILEATPHVTGDQILLELMAERSAAEIASSDVGFIFTIQRATTRVIVQDGETVTIGGLTQTELSESRSGIPILMDLPLVGRLFRVTRQNAIQRDLIILVTPHIVRPLTS